MLPNYCKLKEQESPISMELKKENQAAGHSIFLNNETNLSYTSLFTALMVLFPSDSKCY